MSYIGEVALGVLIVLSGVFLVFIFGLIVYEIVTCGELSRLWRSHRLEKSRRISVQNILHFHFSVLAHLIEHQNTNGLSKLTVPHELTDKTYLEELLQRSYQISKFNLSGTRLMAPIVCAFDFATFLKEAETNGTGNRVFAISGLRNESVDADENEKRAAAAVAKQHPRLKLMDGAFILRVQKALKMNWLNNSFKFNPSYTHIEERYRNDRDMFVIQVVLLRNPSRVNNGCEGSTGIPLEVLSIATPGQKGGDTTPGHDATPALNTTPGPNLTQQATEVLTTIPRDDRSIDLSSCDTFSTPHPYPACSRQDVSEKKTPILKFSRHEIIADYMKTGGRHDDSGLDETWMTFEGRSRFCSNKKYPNASKFRSIELQSTTSSIAPMSRPARTPNQDGRSEHDDNEIGSHSRLDDSFTSMQSMSPAEQFRDVLNDTDICI